VTGSRVSALLTLLALFAMRLTPVGAQAEQGQQCRLDPASPAVADARTLLDRNAASLDARFKLSDVLRGEGCFEDAVKVLEAGEAFHPDNAALRSKLQIARSYVGEQRYFAGLESAEVEARFKRNLLRCERLSDVPACDEALSMRPASTAALLGKVDNLLKANRPADALPLLKKAGDAGAAAAEVRARTVTAEVRRRELATLCEAGSGDAALEACALALLPGAADEFVLRKRQGSLLQAANKTPQALESYLAAAGLNSHDAAVALAIVALTDSTGRRDAVALAARGTALLTLGRPDEARTSLKQAAALDASIPGIRQSLAAAAESTRQRAREHAELAAAAAERARAVEPAPPATASNNPRTYSNEEKAGRSH